MRLTFFLMLPSLILSQDENIGQVLWNGGSSILELDKAVLSGLGGAIWNIGGEALDSLGSLLNADGSNNAATGKSTTDSNFVPVAGGSAPDDKTESTTGTTNTAEQTFKLHAVSGPGLDGTTNPVAGETVEPATGRGDAIQKTDDFLDIPNGATSEASPNLLGDPAQLDNPAASESPLPTDSFRVKTSLDLECDSTISEASDTDNSCDQPTPRIIWPIQCGDSTSIQDALDKAGVNHNDIRTSQDACGTYFLTVPMTEEQTRTALERAEGSIKAIVNDDPMISDGLSGPSEPDKKKRKRANRQITIKQAPSHLHAISVPWRIENDYVYLENAGESIEGYMLVLADTSMISADREFTTGNIIKGYLAALAPVGYKTSPDYEPPVPGSALSLVSVVGGERYGVIKKASLTLITMVPTTSSFLDGLQILRRLLQIQLSKNNPVRARTVVMTPIGFRSLPVLDVTGLNNPTDRTNEDAAFSLVTDLINRFQVVFFCAAGEVKIDLDGTRVKEPYQWPATWAGRPDSPAIITVGGVDQGDGQVADKEPGYFKLTGSVSGDRVHLYAPYFVYASFGDVRPSPRPTGGTAYSLALAAGLGMDFLSRPDVRHELNLIENEQGTAQMSTAEKLRDYMERKSFARKPGGPNVIWNGLGDAPPPQP